MGKFKAGLVTFLLLLSACNRVRGALVEAPPPPPPATQTCADGSVVAATDSCPAFAVEYMAVTSVVDRNMKLVAIGGGYATILMSPGHAARAQRACEKAVETMEPTKGVPDRRPTVMDGTLVYDRPVYWPVKATGAAKCSRMVPDYDYKRAAALLRRLPGSDRFGIGPFVVVWRADGRQAGMFDFSQVPTSDFGREFGAVARYMSRRSDVWNPSFYQSANYRQIIKMYLLEGSPAPQLFAKLFKLA